MSRINGIFTMSSVSRLWCGLLWLVTASLAYTSLSDESLRHIPNGDSDFDIHKGALLAPILIPRVPGTPGSAKTQRHFIDFFAKNLPTWTLETHNSTSTTPATGGRQIPFTNLIFRRDPPWANPGDVGRLTLVAHYDSLYKPEGFIGATDSAVPCAILMHVARSVDTALTRKWDSMQANGQVGGGLQEEKGIQVLFIDGEEAWETWTDTDSLYGSRRVLSPRVTGREGADKVYRALAESWGSSTHDGFSTFSTQLESISLFLLLDLLGAPKPSVPSYFEKTHWAYQNLATAEERLRRLGLLETKAEPGPFLPESGKKSYQFIEGMYVLDDHVPFLQRGVDVLHIIPTPFPPVWHTMDDDGAHLHVPTARDWARIVTAFTAEWLELDGLLTPGQRASKYDEKLEL